MQGWPLPLKLFMDSLCAALVGALLIDSRCITTCCTPSSRRFLSLLCLLIAEPGGWLVSCCLRVTGWVFSMLLSRWLRRLGFGMRFFWLYSAVRILLTRRINWLTAGRLTSI